MGLNVMAKDLSAYQQKIVSRYYDNRDQIDDQRLSELVTSIYLAKPGSKQMDKLWISAGETMERLRVISSRVQHVMEKRDPAILAEVVKELQNGTLKREPVKK
ncbi:hypothetical protein SH668x_003178 [Planctomicrobium sp. SH668]|uniref:hypothetical protein n=1 Tax=Planctomicrobium sp. SH668 TaxID=3448126 RepID=UPI003F5B8899